MKKKDKKKFKRTDIRLKNLNIDDPESFTDDELLAKKAKAQMKIAQKYSESQKSGLIIKIGLVIEIKSNYQANVLIEEKIYEAILSGRLKQISFDTKNIITVGDFVKVDFSNQPRIEEILKRKNSLSRYNEAKFQKQMILAANIDQIIITVAYKNPEIKYGLIDRYICAAEIENIVPVICVNKIDLKDKKDKIFENSIDYYRKSGYTVIFTSAEKGYGIDELKMILKNKVSLFSGHSGVGKSSIINKLEAGINLKVGKVSDYSQKGQHTTSTARMIEWSFGGFLIDSPGLRSFTLSKEDIVLIPRLFPGFKDYYPFCKFSDCTHIHEKDCAVIEAVEENVIPRNRYDSYLRIYDSLKL